jgi:hypothetical protein
LAGAHTSVALLIAYQQNHAWAAGAAMLYLMQNQTEIEMMHKTPAVVLCIIAQFQGIQPWI